MSVARSTPRARWSMVALASLPLAFLILPTLIVVPLSFTESASFRFPPTGWSWRWYQAFLGSPDWLAALSRSLVAAVLTTFLATAVGVLAAWSLRQLPRRQAQAVRVLLLSPAIIPGILVGIGVFFVYARLGLNNTLLGLVLAHTVLALPFVVLTLESGLARLDPALEMAARSLGASSGRAFLTIALPQIRRSVVVAALFGFLTSFDEISVAFFISSGDKATLPRRMFSALRDDFDPTIAAISTLLVIVTAVVVLASLSSRNGRDRP